MRIAFVYSKISKANENYKLLLEYKHPTEIEADRTGKVGITTASPAHGFMYLSFRDLRIGIDTANGIIDLFGSEPMRNRVSTTGLNEAERHGSNIPVRSGFTISASEYKESPENLFHSMALPL